MFSGKERAVKELEYTKQTVPKDKRFCTICGEVKRVHYFEGDSTHCSACCEKMLHTRLNGRVLPVLLILLLVVTVSVLLSVQTVPYCIAMFKADAAQRDTRLSDACSMYALAIADASNRNAIILNGGKTDESGHAPAPTKTLFEAGSRTWARYLDLYAALFSEREAASIAEGSLDKHVTAAIPAIARFAESKQAYEESLAFAEETADKYAADEEAKQYDEIIAELTAYADASDSRYIKGYMEYYKGRATQFFKADDSAAATAFYEKMLDYLPDEFMTVYSAEADAALGAENYEAAIEAYEKILGKNKNYTDAYPAIADAAFLAGDSEKLEHALAQFGEDDPLRLMLEMRFALRSDDLDRAAEVRKKAQQTAKKQADQAFNIMLADQEIEGDNKTLLLNYVDYALYDAAFALVQGDTDTAFQIAYNEAFNYAYYYAYITNDSGALSQSVINMTTLCASLVKDKEALKTVEEIGACDETTQQMIDGELTAREVFIEGKAAIL